MDVQSAPYRVLDALFDANLAQAKLRHGDSPDGHSRSLEEVASSFAAAAAQHVSLLLHSTASPGASDIACSLPLLDSASLRGVHPDSRAVRPDSLVRYVGMVQDVYGSEYYSPLRTIYRAMGGAAPCPNAFRDEVPSGAVEGDPLHARLLQPRITMHCVPIPGEAAWARAAHRPGASVAPTVAAGSSHVGRGVTAGLESDMLAHPLPHETGVPAQIRMYGDTTSAALPRIGDVIEVVGIYTPDPYAYGGGEEEEEDMDQVESTAIGERPVLTDTRPSKRPAAATRGVDVARGDRMEEEDGLRDLIDPPHALVPRVHCIAFRHLPASYPVLQPDSTESAYTSIALPYDAAAVTAQPSLQQRVCKRVIAALDASVLPLARARVLDYLTAILGGDALVAELLLCHLLSGVCARKGVHLLGKSSLAITCMPLTDTTHTQASVVGLYLRDALSALLPRVACLPMHMNALHSHRYTPARESSSDKLLAGMLQLSAGTHVVIDETVVSEGALQDAGVRALQAMRTLAADQVVHYHFPYAEPIEFHVDIPVIVLSCARSTLVGCDVTVPLDALASDALRALVAARDVVIATEEMKTYVALCRGLDYAIPDEVSAGVQASMVALRAEDRSVTSDDLHALLTLARLLTLSHAQRELNMDLWARALLLTRQIGVRKAAPVPPAVPSTPSP